MKRIMIVDDSPSSVAHLVGILENNGYITIHTEDSTEALMLILTETPNALIIDLEMPGLSGAELIQMVRAWPQGRQIPILALAQGGERDEITKALLAGANDVLPKPVQENRLLEHISSRFWHQAPRLAVSNGTDLIPRMATAGLMPRKVAEPPGPVHALASAAKGITNFVAAVSPWARMGPRRK